MLQKSVQVNRKILATPSGHPQKNFEVRKKHDLMAQISNHTYNIQKWAN